MEILQKELAYAKTLLKKDPNISTLDGLVHLGAKTTIQLKSLDVALDNWDATLKHIMVMLISSTKRENIENITQREK